MAHRFQELETDGKAVVAQALAVSDAGLGAKIARKRRTERTRAPRALTFSVNVVSTPGSSW
jgi:hypothetical protein